MLPFLRCGSWPIIENKQWSPLACCCRRTNNLNAYHTLSFVPVTIGLPYQHSPDFPLIVIHIRTAVPPSCRLVGGDLVNIRIPFLLIHFACLFMPRPPTGKAHSEGGEINHLISFAFWTLPTPLPAGVSHGCSRSYISLGSILHTLQYSTT